MIDNHHLLECILWPNGDGTFRKIINTQKRLEGLGVYDDWKLTIPIDHSIHQTMHREFKRGTEHSNEGKNNPMYGRSGDKNPMYGMSKDKNPNWKGDKAQPPAIYMRARRLYRSGKMTENEFQPFRDIWNEFRRERRKNQRSLNSLPID